MFSGEMGLKMFRSLTWGFRSRAAGHFPGDGLRQGLFQSSGPAPEYRKFPWKMYASYTNMVDMLDGSRPPFQEQAKWVSVTKIPAIGIAWPAKPYTDNG